MHQAGRTPDQHTNGDTPCYLPRGSVYPAVMSRMPRRKPSRSVEGIPRAVHTTAITARTTPAAALGMKRVRAAGRGRRLPSVAGGGRHFPVARRYRVVERRLPQAVLMLDDVFH